MTEKAAEQSDVLAFYQTHGISPVAQSINDLPAHYRRRRSLYHLLGLTPSAVRGRRVVEFGPGSGHNPLYTASLRPAFYRLVDGNETGLRETRELLAAHGFDNPNIAYTHNLFTDVPPTGDFDLALCEGVTNIQKDPATLIRHIARFVASDGLLLLTCVDAVSFLSEICRRLLAALVAPADAPLVRRLELVRPYFAPHVATLSGMSRFPDHWVIDVLLAPRLGRFWGIDQTIRLLDADFDFLAASPRFAADWRWYKTVNGEFNQPTLEAFTRWRHCLIDCRAAPFPADPAETQNFARLCDDACEAMEQAILDPGPDSINAVLTAMGKVEVAARVLAPETTGAIADFISIVDGWRPGTAPAAAQAFASWFGRGQQYLTLARRGGVA